jgi:hypothetical protein
MNKWIWLLLLFVAASTAVYSATAPQGNAQRAAESRYFVHLINCDDGCTAEMNGEVLSSTSFAQDSGWIDITEALEDGGNQIKFTVNNDGGGIAYGFQIRKNQTMLFEKICGRAGAIGCDNNRIFPKGVARTFTYEILRSPSERPASYTKWLTFLGEFRAALNRRDRVALRGMIAIPFDTQEGQLRSFDAVMKWLDREMMQELQREIAPGARFTFSFTSPFEGRGRRPTRSSGIFYFELGTDGRWRLSGQGENEPG